MDPHDPEIELRVPPSLSLADLAAAVRRLEGKFDRVLRLLSRDPLEPQAPAGLVQRQDAQESHLADLELRVTAIEEDQHAAAERWGGRVWTTAYDIAKLAGAAGLGAWLGKGGAP